eukprot:GHVR01131473.1.p1 GENE.GHVR01131473.1~~GHVR01131473.1.p1  ORF type:complete len:301 (+),score=28.69 GHVR01131473.1:101-1003(+)
MGYMYAIFCWYFYTCRDTSTMAQKMMIRRAGYHYAGLRHDPQSAAVSEAVAVYPQWLLLFFLKSFQLFQFVSGYKLFNYPVFECRSITDYFSMVTTFIDSQVEATKLSQFCVIGAGFDVRCYKDTEREKVKCFEVDRGGTQLVKRKALEDAGIDSSKVCFVSVDLMKESLIKKLQENGYNTNIPCVFLLENVVWHLSHSAIQTIFNDIYTNSANGSLIIFNYFTESFIKNTFWGKFIEKTLPLISEPILSSIQSVNCNHPSASVCRDAGVNFCLRHMGFDLVDQVMADGVGGVVLARVAK